MNFGILGKTSRFGEKSSGRARVFIKANFTRQKLFNTNALADRRFYHLFHLSFETYKKQLSGYWPIKTENFHVSICSFLFGQPLRRGCFLIQSRARAHYLFLSLARCFLHYTRFRNNYRERCPCLFVCCERKAES